MATLTAVTGGTSITWTLDDATKALHMMKTVRQSFLAAKLENHVYLDGMTVKALVAMPFDKAAVAVRQINQIMGI